MPDLSALRSMPRNVWVLGFAALFTDASSEMIHALLPVFLVSTLGANASLVGLIEGIAESVASVVKIFSGALSDYLGKRKAIVVSGYALSTVVKPLFAIAQGPMWVLLARTADRIGKGVRGAPRDALVADSVLPENRGAAFGLRQSLDTVGAFMGPIGAFLLMLITHGDVRFVFWVAVIPAVVAVLLLLFGVSEAEPKPSPKRSNPLHWSELKGLGREYWILVVAALVFNLGNSSDAFLLLRAKQLGVAVSLLPLTMVVMNAVYSSTAYPLGLLSDRLGRFGFLICGFVVYAITYAGFYWASAPWHVWLLFALYGIYLGMSQGVLLAMVADRVPAERRGTAFGFINLATGITLLPASMLAGVLWDKLSPAAPFAAGSLFSLVSVALLLVGLRRPSADSNKVT